MCSEFAVTNLIVICYKVQKQAFETRLLIQINILNLCMRVGNSNLLLSSQKSCLKKVVFKMSDNKDENVNRYEIGGEKVKLLVTKIKDIHIFSINVKRRHLTSIKTILICTKTIFDMYKDDI